VAVVDQIPAVQTITFTVLGKAQPGGSKRAFRHPGTGRALVVDANKKAKPWQAVVAAAGHDAMGGRGLLDGPLAVRIVFYAPRPQSHYRTGRNRAMLRAAAPMFPTTRPDALKLARAVEDALTGVCWRDDSLIVDEQLHKRYGEPARAEVEITPLDWGSGEIATVLARRIA
jgi:crossover junction endodeoxyribonuclease RusA